MEETDTGEFEDGDFSEGVVDHGIGANRTVRRCSIVMVTSWI